MLGHTKMHFTKGFNPYGPSKVPQEEMSLPWREAAEENIKKYTEVGALIRGGRYKAGLTQKALAEKLCIKQHHISEMEHGKRPVGKKMAMRFAEIFDVDYRVFL